MDNRIEEKTSAELIGDYARLLWHWAWLLALVTAIAGGVAYWVSRNQVPVYQASTLVMIDAAPNAQLVTSTSLNTSEQLAATYAKVMVTMPVLDGVATQLKLPAFPETASVQVQPIPNTQLMSVVVQDTDPQRAALLANTLVQVFSDQIQADQAVRYADSKKSLEDQLANLEQQIQTVSGELAAINNDPQKQSEQDRLQTALTQYRQSYASLLQSYEQVKLAEAQSSSGIIQKDPAVLPKDPVKPRPVRDALLAAIAGLLMAVGGVFLIEFLDDTIRDPEEITRKWGVPVLGTIISYDHEKNTLITARQPRSPITEAFRSLRTNLQFVSVDFPLRTLLVTSPSPEDGKTTVAANLGSVIAQTGRSTVVVDADLRRPRLHRVFGFPNRFGLTDFFVHAQDRLNGSLKQTEIKGLNILTTGNLPPNPSELLGSDRMEELLHQLTEQYDMVILDTPPLLLVTDALVLASRVNGVLIVVKPSVTKRTALKHALEQLQQVKANVIGVVLNDVRINSSRYYNYRGYYYSQKYGKKYHYSERPGESPVKSPTKIGDRDHQSLALKKNDDGQGKEE